MVTLNKSSTKAVAPVVGFLLIVAILFIAAGQYQMNVVPEQERSAEVDHFSEVTEDFAGLRNAIMQSSSTGQLETQEIQTGVTYGVPGVTQPPVGGTILYNEADSEIEVRNAQNNREASNYWRGDENRTYETGFIEYNIGYNRLQDHTDIFIEHGFLYGDYARGSDEEVQFLPQSEQPIVDGRSITLYTVQADDLVASRTGTTTMETNPVSAPMNSIAITDFNNPIEIQIPTRLDVDDWEEILEDEIRFEGDEEDAYVEEIREADDEDAIILEFVEDETYNLRMSRVDLTTQDQQTAISSTEEQYIAVETESANIREDSAKTLEAQVRDKYNNGVIGVPVQVEAQESDARQRCIGDFDGTTSPGSTRCDNEGEYRQPGEDISGSEGDVSFVYEAPEVDNDRDVSFIYLMDDEEQN